AAETEFGSDGRLLAVTTLGFDIAALEIFMPLMRGGGWCLCSAEEARDAAGLRAAIRRERPSLMQATPATWRMLVASGWRNEERVGILCGGEALPADLARAFTENGMRAWNVYGPTETTIWSTLQRLEPGGPAGIGRPV